MALKNPARPVIDSLVIAALLVIANLVLNSGDRGWLALNPSPFLLLPLLIGGKYGLRGGLAAGLAALVIVFVLGCSTGTDWMDVLKSAPLVFLSLPVMGLISGELHRQSAGRRCQLEVENADLALAKSVFEKDLALSLESQHLLQKELSLQGADACSLDLELRKIFEPGAPPFLRGTLSALAEVSGLTDAGFYLLGENGESLERSEFIGDEAFFPASFGAKHNKMAWAAIESDELVTCRGLGEGQGDIGKARFLAAIPWRRDGKVAGVLLIHDMPFLAMNWQTLARVELVCDWVAIMVDMATRSAEGGREISDFKSALGLAGRSLAEQGLPSAIALLTATSALTVGEMRDAIAGEMRATDLAIEVGDRGLAVLFPLEAGRDSQAAAELFLGALDLTGKKASVNLWTIDDAIEVDALWGEIENSFKV